MAIYEIPLTAKPQAFSISLSGTTYRITMKWSAFGQSWVLDIADEEGAAIVSGIPVVTGSDLLEQYAYLNFGGKLIASSDDGLAPDFANLGITAKVYWETVDA